MNRITIKRVAVGYRTWVNNNVEVYSDGETMRDAISNLVFSQRDIIFQEPTILTVSKRDIDFIAYKSSDKRCWGTGKTETKAIANLIFDFPHQMGFKLDFILKIAEV